MSEINDDKDENYANGDFDEDDENQIKGDERSSSMVNTSSLSKLSQRNDRSSGKMSRESKKSVTKNIEKS